MTHSNSQLKSIFILLLLSLGLFISSCKTQKSSTTNSTKSKTETEDVTVKQPDKDKKADKGDKTKVKTETHTKPNPVGNNKYDPAFTTTDSVYMAEVYADVLAPISGLKFSDPKIYWFIVSWLNTKYKTPPYWTGYPSGEWKKNAKLKGIDCSGFARVMEKEIFGKNIMGSSQGLLDNYCLRVTKASLKMGDLVFFRAYSTEPVPDNKIVHVGVYLMDGYFVHATSTKSASKGLGLNISSLSYKKWATEFVSGGKIKAN